MPRYFLDTEFHEEQNSIELISIGIVCEDGREYYRENFDYDRRRAHPWLRANVLPHLRPLNEAKMPSAIAVEVQRFCDPAQYGKPEFWGYYADYDWVCFAWLFGAMIDLPQGFPMYCRDIKQWADDLGNPCLPEQDEAEHDALADARWNMKAWECLAATASKEEACPKR